MCSADMDDGWGLLFCWHKTSSTACRSFLRSLATVIHEGRPAEAALLRIVAAYCENLAVARVGGKLSVNTSESGSVLR